MTTPLRLALLINTNAGYNRGLLRAMHAAILPGKRFVMIQQPPDPLYIPRVLAWEPDAVIGDLFHPETNAAIAGLRVPVVSLSGEDPDAGFPVVATDDHAIGMLAAEHFLERGYRHYAFLGAPNRAFARQREAGFAARLATAQLPVSRFTAPAARSFGTAVYQTPHFAALQAWLRELPKPVALFCANDQLAVEASLACEAAEVHVPQEVALLGVDNDDLLCLSVHPPLSSIRLPLAGIGQEAVRLVERLLVGAPPPATVLLPPDGVTVRLSSDALAVDDPRIHAALRFIWTHAGEPITVEDVLQQVPLSRRAFERLFRQVVGRAPHEEIRRVHLERARELLAQTDDALDIVAHRAGLPDATHLCRLFRRHLGTTPATYRRQHHAPHRG